MSERRLILSDGGLPSLVAAALAADEALLAGAGDHPLVVPTPAFPCGEIYADAIRRQCERLRLDLLPPVQPTLASADGEGETRDLLAATYGAARAGASVVVWPVTAWRGEGIDIDRLAQAADRALLVGRLVALDASTHAMPSIRVETPLLDFSDTQIVDLAADLGAPIEAVWWWSAEHAEAAAERARWKRALERVGWPAARPARV
ncbi:MAG: hypothetical protein SFY69_10815 [Planctomycetota bacterium]|nr:hypothetical protein [Planctomycetota bacterium]